MKKIFIFILILSVGLIGGLFYWSSSDEKDSDNETKNNSIASENKESTEPENEQDNSQNIDNNNLKDLIFIHHSTGENWLSDQNGGLGLALMNSGFSVSDTNYGWGPDSIGDLTDIGHWWLWFRGPNSSQYMDALYNEHNSHAEYTRDESTGNDENEIILFKSCFPNSNLQGDNEEDIPEISENALRGNDSYSEDHTIAHAKGIYIDLLEYFQTKPDKLFVVITAPPLSKNNTDAHAASNARELSDWLVNDWLDEYEMHNVVVFNFFDLLTNYGESNYLEYPTDEWDDHPNQEGNMMATDLFIPFLLEAYEEWENSLQ